MIPLSCLSVDDTATSIICLEPLLFGANKDFLDAAVPKDPRSAHVGCARLASSLETRSV